VLARAEAAATALDDLGTLRRGRLTIYASQTIASYWLPNRLVAFHAAHPQVELQVHIGNTREVVRAVAEGEAELGFIEGEGDHPVLARETIDRDRLIVLVPPRHAWAEGKRLAAHELQSGAWVLREPGSGTRSTLEAALASVGVAVKDLNIVMTLPSNESVLAAATAGAGATALSASVAAAAVSRGQLRVANFNLPDRSYELIHHKERYLTRAAQELIEQIRSDRDRTLPALPEENGSGGGI
jgi:DNA-binding transcriptional LysR family regulator